MDVNKIIINTSEGEKVLVDLTGDTVKPEVLGKGETAHDASGKPIAGTFTLETEMTEQDGLIERIKAALQGKAAGGPGLPTQEKTVEITENGAYEILPDDGCVLSKVGVTVNVEGSSEPDPRDQYQRVEYIESAEEETYPYILTDICADNSTGVEVIASFPILQDRIPMGSRLDSNATRFYCTYPLSSTGSYYGFDTGNSLSGSFAINTIYRCQTNFLGSRMAGMFDSNGARKSGGLISGTLTKQTVPIAIFGYNYGYSGAVTSKREYKLYSAKISQGFEVVREYIPCYRKSDGVVGLLEKFTGTFLTAEEGAFSKGADIDW